MKLKLILHDVDHSINFYIRNTKLKQVTSNTKQDNLKKDLLLNPDFKVYFQLNNFLLIILRQKFETEPEVHQLYGKASTLVVISLC